MKKVSDASCGAEWLKLRKEFLGASDTPKILGLMPWSNGAAEVWLDKTDPEFSIEENDAMRDGTMLEKTIFENFVEQNRDELGIADTHYRPGTFSHDTINFLGCTPDALLGLAKGQERVALEIKTTGEFGWSNYENELPRFAHCQVMHQLGVLGLDVGYLHVWSFGKGTRTYRVERDDRLIDNIFNRLGEFWTQYVQNKVKPSDETFNVSAEGLAELYPTDNGETIEFDERVLPWLEVWDSAKVMKECAKKLEDESKAAFYRLLGDNKKGVIAGRSVSWSRFEQTRVDSKALKSEKPDLFKQYSKTSNSSRLTVK